MDFTTLERLVKTRFEVRHRVDDSRFVRFVPNRAQARFLAACKLASDKRRRQRWITVKARRVGMSRITQAIGVGYMWAYENLQARSMAHYDETAIDMIDACVKMASGVPSPKYRNRPAATYDSTKQYLRFTIEHPGGASIMRRSTAKAPGKGRGLGSSFAHFSEAAHYPLNAPFTSMLPTVAKDIDRSFVMIESTANGKSGTGEAFYDYWINAGDPGKKSDSEFMRFFIPWTEDPYTIGDAKDAADAPQDEEEKILLKVLEKEYGSKRMALERLAWRRREIATEYRGIMEDFSQENPLTWEEAFISSGSPAFSPEERAIVTSTIKEPRYIGEFESKDNGDVVFRERENGRWRVWELPKKDHEYYSGGDAARGIDHDRPNAPPGDFAYIAVLDGTTGEQVAEFMERTNPRDTANELDKVGRFYWTPQRGDFHYALMNIEITGNLGLEVQHQLRDEYHYPIYRFAPWSGRDDRRHRARGGNVSIGWDTNSRTRDQMFAAFRSGIRDSGFVVRSEVLAAQVCEGEMAETGWGDNLTRGHDDALMGAMVVYMGRVQNPPKVIIDHAPDPEEMRTRNVIELPAFGITTAQKDLIQGLEEDWAQLVEMGVAKPLATSISKYLSKGQQRTLVDVKDLWPARSEISGL